MLAVESLWEGGAALPLSSKTCWLASRLKRAVFGREGSSWSMRNSARRCMHVCKAEFWRIGMENETVPAAPV